MAGTDYFTYTNLVANSLARASDVNSRVAAIQGGFALLPVPTKIQQDRSTYCADTGSANAYSVALDFPPASYVAGLRILFKVGNMSTGASTLNVNGLGAIAIKRFDGSATAAGDLVAGHIATVVFDGTNFQLVSPAETVVASYATSASASAASATSSASSASTSAASASTSASSAATSATNAANSASSAANSATNAANSASTVAASLSNYLPLAGGATMTGLFTLAGAPTAALHPATKKYVDDAVFAAGSVSADEVTIHSATGVFGLVTQANNTILGNISGAAAKPSALTQAQLTALVNTFTATLSGVVAAPVTATGKFLRDDNTWQVVSAGGTVTTVSVVNANGVSGTVATATTTPAITLTLGAITPTSVAATGSVSGSNLSGTNTGDQFQSLANNTILGNNAGASQPAAALTGAQVRTLLGLAAIATSGSAADITAGTLAVARGGTGVTSATGTGSVVLSAAPALTGIPTAPTAATATNTPQLATTAFVQANIALCAPNFLTVQSISGVKTLADSDNNDIIFLTGSSASTITANSTPTAGFSCIIASISTGAWTFSCAGGVYTNGATSTVTSVSIPSGARCTAIHKGAGVWLLSGV